MTSHDEDNQNVNIRMELKYCEHCGSLWVRESGAGVVYCGKCRDKVADLPVPRKLPGSLRGLPVGRYSGAEDYKVDVSDEDLPDWEAVGGVA